MRLTASIMRGGADQRVAAALPSASVPACALLPVHGDLVPALALRAGDDADRLAPAASRIGPCSICASKKAPTGRPPTGSGAGIADALQLLAEASRRRVLVAVASA